MIRRVGLGVGALLAVLCAGEIALHFAAQQFAGRAGADESSGDAITVLCVGDSHTYGTGVETSEAYPGRLQIELDTAEPGRFHVVNRGIAGLSSTMVWNRLPNLARLHRADVVLVWAGVNDSWNVSEIEDPAASLWVRLDGWLSRSRLYRLWRVREHGRLLDAEAAEADKARLEFRLSPEGRRVDLDGVEDLVVPRERPHKLDDETRTRMLENYRAIVAWAQASGTKLVLLTYPLQTPNFAWANGVVEQISKESKTPVVRTSKSFERVPLDQRELLWAAHPNKAIYAEIAKDAAQTIQGLAH